MKAESGETTTSGPVTGIEGCLEDAVTCKEDVAGWREVARGESPGAEAEWCSKMVKHRCAATWLEMDWKWWDGISEQNPTKASTVPSHKGIIVSHTSHAWRSNVALIDPRRRAQRVLVCFPEVVGGVGPRLGSLFSPVTIFPNCGMCTLGCMQDILGRRGGGYVGEIV